MSFKYISCRYTEAEAERAHAELANAEEGLVAIQAAAEAELMATREKMWGKLQQAVEKSKDMEKQKKEALSSVAAQEADIARLADEVERLKRSGSAEGAARARQEQEPPPADGKSEEAIRSKRV